MTPDPTLLPPDDLVVEEQLDETTEEVDELVAQITALESVSTTRHAELIERINTCRTLTESLQTSLQTYQRQETESPMLAQIAAQLTQVQAEVSSLKLSLAMTQNRPPLNVSPPATEIPAVEEIVTEVSTEEPNAENVENTTPEPEAKKRRWV